MKQNQVQQKEIRLGTHGEHYGSWMSNPVFYVIGALLALSVVLAVLSFAVFHIAALGVLFSVAAAALLALLVWITWIRKQYVCLVKSRFQKGTAVGILDQSGTGGEPHVQPGAEEARDRDLHQIRP